MDSNDILRRLAENRRKHLARNEKTSKAGELAAQIVKEQKEKRVAVAARPKTTWSNYGSLSELNKLGQPEKPAQQPSFMRTPNVEATLKKERPAIEPNQQVIKTSQQGTQFQKQTRERLHAQRQTSLKKKEDGVPVHLTTKAPRSSTNVENKPLPRVSLISEETKKNLDLDGLNKLLKMAVRPFPKFRKTRLVASQIEEKYGEGGEGFVDPEVMKMLWDRLVKGKSYKAVGQENYRYLSRLMFLGAGIDRPALFRDHVLFNPWCQFVSGSEGRIYRKTIMRHYVNSEMIVESVKTNAEVFRFHLEKCPEAEPLRSLRLFDKEPWAYLARSMLNQETTHETLPKVSNDLVKPDSPLGYKIWERRLSRFTDMIIFAYEKSGSLSKELAEVKAECVLPNGNLRWPTKPSGDALAEAILTPFLQGSNRLPTEAQQINLLKFWIPLFGDPNKPEASLQWAAINEKFRDLIAHWAKGRTLNDYWAFMQQFCRKSTSRVAWEDRERFWRAYWNNGRISDCKIYVPEKAKYSHPLLFEKYRKYNFGVLAGNVPEGRAAMTLILDDTLMAIEINGVGKIRIGSLKRRNDSPTSGSRSAGVFFGMYRLNYQDHIMEFGEGFPHYLGWQRKTSDYIQMLTGKAIPAGARG